MSKKYATWIRLLSSMDLAIALLVMLAIASVIGTIIQQNQLYTSYAIKFGPFWFEVFEFLGLYNVYNQVWFLAVLAFLVVSICFCLWRYTPILLREIKAHPAQQTWHHLRYFKYAHLQTTAHSIETIEQKLQQDGRYTYSAINTHQDKEGEYFQITAKRGKGQRLGYLFTHIGVVVICLGALLDSSVLLKIDEWLGTLKYETKNISLNEIDEKSFLSADNRTFRGSVSIPEGKSTRVVFLPWSEGYLVQNLPFIVELEDFRIEHYPTGQPSSFESDLVIRDLKGSLITTRTIDVNHPLSVEGIRIYQSSFEDGGSILDFSMLPLYADMDSTFRLSVNKNKALTINQQAVTFELTDFRLFNIQPLEHSPNKFRNQGPSFTYKLRSPTGIATEYQNYMAPFEKGGQYFLISGIRQTPQEPFQYLYIPLDDDFSPNRFLTLVKWLKDDEKLTRILTQSQVIKTQFPAQFTLAIQKRIVKNFIEEGSESLIKHFAQIQDPAQKQKMHQVLGDLLHLIISEVYSVLIQEENATKNIEIAVPLSDEQIQFYTEALHSLSIMHRYHPPAFFRLDTFKHIQASGLQFTKAPGQFWVYLGCLLLVIGLFCMFYLPISRLWVTLKNKQLLITIDSVKNDSDHQQEMQRLIKLLS